MGDHHVQPDRYQLERELAQTEIHDADSQCVPHHGRTNFEKHQLNDMIDMVESANPEHLEDAGKALWDARDAINAAADELSAHIGRIDWHGEAANAFHKWASGLVTNAYTLAVYVENAGSHVTAASTGLASVRKSMPPRDTRLMPKSVDDFPMVTQVAGNKDYQAALTVEGHRQEAINQMNRLASYYTVTGESLRDGQAPTFGKMPEMGVPRPSTEWLDEGSGDQTSPSGTRVPGGGPVRHHSLAAPAGPDAAQNPEPVKKLHDVVTAPDRHVHTDSPQPVGTDIDSVKTLPPDTVKPTAPVTPPTAPAPGGGGGGPIPPVPVGPMPPTVRLPIGPGGTGGSRGPMSTTPRMAPRAGGSSRIGGGTGRGPVGPVGRTAVPGEVEPRGPVSPVGRAPVGKAPLGEAPVGRGPIGRSVVGGTPRTVGVPAERVGGTGPTGAARTSGVIGGRPTTPSAQAVNGSKVPRATVVGGESASPNPRAAERPGQRGVISVPEQEGGGHGQASRRPVTPTGGVVGTSSGNASMARNGGRVSGENVAGRASAVKRGSAQNGARKSSRRQQAPETE
ncbi:WXG100 family type VII secretion target [Streptomyces sp. NRAIS4]